MDYLVFRPVFAENSGAVIDVMKCNLETVMKMNEFLDIRDEIATLQMQKQQAEMDKMSR